MSAPAVVFLDVDGVLSPLRSLAGDGAWGAWASEAVPGMGTLGFSAAMLTTIGDAPAQLVWATDWSDDANEVIAGRIGRGTLPVLRSGEGRRDHGWWKLGVIEAWAARNPDVRRAVWVDDKLGDEGPTGRTWAELMTTIFDDLGVELLLVRPNLDVGLTVDEWASARAWLARPTGQLASLKVCVR